MYHLLEVLAPMHHILVRSLSMLHHCIDLLALLVCHAVHVCKKERVPR